MADPSNFSPVVDGVLSTSEWKKFNFDAEDTNEIFQVAPGLVVDRLVPSPLPVSAPPAIVEDLPAPVAPERKFENDEFIVPDPPPLPPP